MTYENSIEGWMSPVELNWLHQQALLHNLIVEIGSYRGRSTAALCDGCPGIVHAVDRFRDEDFYHFLKNIRAPDRRNLVILRMESIKAADQFHDKFMDMVFIDGDHSYEGCRADIAAWLPKCRGLICGHDYTDDGKGHWPGVVKAVNEVFPVIEKIETLWAVHL